ncbi:hypothetical protein D1007_10960 [Hordeum vulgare]|nr:hypothetical protein D1007_10960 [Hordeum vulgare]
MAKASKVSPTLNPNISHDDDVDDNEDDDKDEESDDIASLKIKGEKIFNFLYKNKLACSNFMKIMSIATKGKKYIEELEAHLEEHEATIERMEGHDHDYANEIAELSQSLENEQTTKESLEETFALELSRLKESHDRALEQRLGSGSSPALRWSKDTGEGMDGITGDHCVQVSSAASGVVGDVTTDDNRGRLVRAMQRLR